MNAYRCCSLPLGTAHSTTPVLTRLVLTRLPRIITATGNAAGFLPVGGDVCALEGINEQTVRLQPPCVACRVQFCDALRAEREASGAVPARGRKREFARGFARNQPRRRARQGHAAGAQGLGGGQ
jgi:hypothetical protein